MSEKCNVPNAVRSTLNKTLTSRQHKSNLSDSRIAANSRRHAFDSTDLSGSQFLFPSSFRSRRSTNNHHFSIPWAAVPLGVCSIWNNECVWKCLIKSNKSLCDLFVQLFFSLSSSKLWKMWAALGRTSSSFFLFFIYITIWRAPRYTPAHGEPDWRWSHG